MSHQNFRIPLCVKIYAQVNPTAPPLLSRRLPSLSSYCRNHRCYFLLFLRSTESFKLRFDSATIAKLKMRFSHAHPDETFGSSEKRYTDLVDTKTGRKPSHTCYRTWRKRGFCACFLDARILLVRSELDAPIWISPQESLKLAVGECEFTCCLTNHRSRGDTKMKCSRRSRQAESIFVSRVVVMGSSRPRESRTGI